MTKRRTKRPVITVTDSTSTRVQLTSDTSTEKLTVADLEDFAHVVRETFTNGGAAVVNVGKTYDGKSSLVASTGTSNTEEKTA